MSREIDAPSSVPAAAHKHLHVDKRNPKASHQMPLGLLAINVSALLLSMFLVWLLSNPKQA